MMIWNKFEVALIVEIGVVLNCSLFRFSAQNPNLEQNIVVFVQFLHKNRQISILLFLTTHPKKKLENEEPPTGTVRYGTRKNARTTTEVNKRKFMSLHEFRHGTGTVQYVLAKISRTNKKPEFDKFGASHVRTDDDWVFSERVRPHQSHASTRTEKWMRRLCLKN